MSSREVPADPQALRAEIADTRADLGDTVQALAAKTDVRARAADAVGHVADQAKDTVRVVGGQVKAGADSVRETIADVDLPAVARRPVPVAVLAGAVLGVALAIYWWRRRS